MKFMYLVLASYIMMPLLSYSADTVTINVTGNIVASPCIVNGGSNSLNVDLGNIQATALSTPGAASTPVPFTLSVTNCPNGTSTVRADFDGSASHDAPNLYENMGTAGNVYIALYDGVTGDALGPGCTLFKSVQSDRTASIPLKVNAYSIDGTTTPGSINTAIVLTMSYQ